MQFLLLLTIVPSLLADGGDHHGHHGGDQYGSPASQDTYGSPGPVSDTYGHPNDVSSQYSVQPQQYAAPSSQYGPTQDEYGVPATDYQSQEYGVPSYETPATGYGPSQPKDLFDFSRIGEFLPLFLAVIAAVIVAQIFAPLIGGLFGAKVGLLSGVIGPLSGAKLGLLNAVLQPLGFAICDVSGGTPVLAGRSSEEDFTFNQDTIDLVSKMLYNAIDNYSS